MVISAVKRMKLINNTAPSAHFSQKIQHSCNVYRGKQVMLRSLIDILKNMAKSKAIRQSILKKAVKPR